MDVLSVSEHYAKVVDFMNKAGQEVPTSVKEPSKEIRILRAKLILEEALETINALGCSVDVGVPCDDLCNEKPRIFADIDKTFNLAEVIDGCCDIKVVTTGTLIACGVPDEYAQDLVDESNLRKFGPGGYRRDDGKWIKSKDWKAPDWDLYLKELDRSQNEICKTNTP